MNDVSEPTRLEYSLRPACAHDYGFAEGLYLETSRPLYEKLGMWDRESVSTRFGRLFKHEQTSIVCVDGEAVGWLQTTETEQCINLVQIHLKADFRCAGIGSRLIGDLMQDAKSKRKPVLLSVVRNNPALALYKRLGFRIISENAEKLRLRWDHDKPET